MNSQRNLLKRLIKLFPVKLLKDDFNIKLFSDDLINNIVDNNPPQIVKNFAYSNLNYTKQHVYIYELNGNKNHMSFIPDDFPFEVINHNSDGDNLTIMISPIVDFNVILSQPYEEAIIQFHQPGRIKLTADHLIFQTTMLEKNLKTYFDGNRKVLDVEKQNDEQSTLKEIIDFFEISSTAICDINRGVKYLWENDLIDSKYAKWKKARSTTTEAMDENYTLKSQYPDIYEDIMGRPLKKTIFKYLNEDEELPDHFTVDPTIGQLSVPLYSKNINQIQNVINEILSNN